MCWVDRAFGVLRAAMIFYGSYLAVAWVFGLWPYVR